MKRKAVGLLLAGVMTAAAGSRVQAMTYAWEGRNGMVSYYTQEERDWAVSYYEEAQWYRTEMEEALAYLKEYGVTYDREQDVVFYRGKTVRRLMDEQPGGGKKAFEMPEGEIDVYTVRGEDFRLTGVREATQEEFDELTRQQERAEKLSGDVVQIELTETSEASVEAAGAAAENADRAEATESDFQESGTAVERDYFESSKARCDEYKAAGIDCNPKDGGWLWDGRPVFWLVDEDGSMYQNGEAKQDKIYILVKRNDDGSIKEAKQITAEEVLMQRIQNMEELETGAEGQ